MTILDEIRDAYASVGIALDQPLTYGTYYRPVSYTHLTLPTILLV